MANAIEFTAASQDEQIRVAQQLSDRLRNRGVAVHARDSGEDLAIVFEAVEHFEAAVEQRGGDLMVDEPPAGHRAEPDNAAFVLPARSVHESALTYASRLDGLTAKLRV